MLKDIEETDTRYNYIIKKITFVIRMLSQQGIWFIIKKEKGREGEDMKDTGISDYKEKASHGDVLMPIQRYRCIVPFSYQDYGEK